MEIVFVVAIAENGVIGARATRCRGDEIRHGALQGAHDRQAGDHGPQDLRIPRAGRFRAVPISSSRAMRIIAAAGRHGGTWMPMEGAVALRRRPAAFGRRDRRDWRRRISRNGLVAPIASKSPKCTRARRRHAFRDYRRGVYGMRLSGCGIRRPGRQRRLTPM